MEGTSVLSVGLCSVTLRSERIDGVVRCAEQAGLDGAARLARERGRPELALQVLRYAPLDRLPPRARCAGACPVREEDVVNGAQVRGWLGRPNVTKQRKRASSSFSATLISNPIPFESGPPAEAVGTGAEFDDAICSGRRSFTNHFCVDTVNTPVRPLQANARADHLSRTGATLGAPRHDSLKCSPATSSRAVWPAPRVLSSGPVPAMEHHSFGQSLERRSGVCALAA